MPANSKTRKSPKRHGTEISAPKQEQVPMFGKALTKDLENIVEADSLEDMCRPEVLQGKGP